MNDSLLNVGMIADLKPWIAIFRRANIFTYITSGVLFFANCITANYEILTQWFVKEWFIMFILLFLGCTMEEKVVPGLPAKNTKNNDCYFYYYSSCSKVRYSYFIFVTVFLVRGIVLSTMIYLYLFLKKEACISTGLFKFVFSIVIHFRNGSLFIGYITKVIKYPANELFFFQLKFI